MKVTLHLMTMPMANFTFLHNVYVGASMCLQGTRIAPLSPSFCLLYLYSNFIGTVRHHIWLQISIFHRMQTQSVQAHQLKILSIVCKGKFRYNWKKKYFTTCDRENGDAKYKHWEKQEIDFNRFVAKSIMNHIDRCHWWPLLWSVKLSMFSIGFQF